MGIVNKNQEGFGVVEVIILAVIVSVIAGIGFLVVRKEQNSPTQQSSANVSSDKDNAGKDEMEQSANKPYDAEQDVKPRDTIVREEPREIVPGTIAGQFSQSPESTWPSGQTIAYIGVSTPNGSKVSKVEWYLGEGSQELKHTLKTGPSSLYQYNWPISSLPNGKYHWTARVYDESGNYQLVKARDGNDYINMYVSN